tara:strand:- start:260 stop:532 length:273 start_codon:yes stop_codon:yes gene_type:complete
MKNLRNGNHSALKEFMLHNEPISRLEATLMFGTQNLPTSISSLRKDGFIIKSQKIPMITVLKRLQKYCICKPPSNLPVKEILVTEYWVSR